MTLGVKIDLKHISKLKKKKKTIEIKINHMNGIMDTSRRYIAMISRTIYKYWPISAHNNKPPTSILHCRCPLKRICQRISDVLATI